MKRPPKSSILVWRPKKEVTINESAAEAIDPAVAVEPKPPPVKGEVHLLPGTLRRLKALLDEQKQRRVRRRIA